MTNLLPEWEDGNFHLAKYYDKVMPMVTDNKLEKQGNLIRYIVLYFGKWVAFQPEKEVFNRNLLTKEYFNY